MSRKIILLVIAIIIIVVTGYWIYQTTLAPERELELSQEQVCINSGGIVRTAMCCKSSGDFPNLCLIGSCGCSLENSHQVKICNCGPGKCFNGKECVSQ